MDNLVVFPTVKKKSKNQLTVNEAIAKSLTPLFSETQCTA